MKLRSHDFATAAVFLSLSGCGSSSDRASPQESPEAAASSSVEASASADGVSLGGDDAGSVLGADGPPAALADGGASDDAGSTGRDGSSSGNDASLLSRDGGGPAPGDGGAQPFKGVANSGCGDLLTLGASWYYNWTLSRGNCNASRFVPMVWGHPGNEQTATGIASEVKGVVASGYDTVLGFNEPDNATQSKIAVATAISLWPAFNNPSLRIGSPATQANTTGVAWFTSFMSQVNADTSGALRVDFIAAHWYGWNAGSCDANAVSLEAYIKQIEAIPGSRPIWLTEWGCLNLSNPTAAAVQAFYTGALAVFARHPRIERYAWYPWTTNNQLVSTGGALTSLGTAFAAAPAIR